MLAIRAFSFKVSLHLWCRPTSLRFPLIGRLLRDLTPSTIRIGAGAGYSGDRIPPALELAEHGRLDYPRLRDAITAQQ